MREITNTRRINSSVNMNGLLVRFLDFVPRRKRDWSMLTIPIPFERIEFTIVKNDYTYIYTFKEEPSSVLFLADVC
jgi:hypothetical protein